ncbi:bifunctional homocysteine S-methyltransferase/methylenetetrahydrofolate reductase [Fimbriimonas ginsengisoli]|uniref:MetX n=1 Tax=Fimbriimonas ginsengisoli Gsoil 348 TaxID=661478 RepID=A0A068NQ65_FIMGI|nr:bifunctional homocysteine S-methyltransferase/methylenetetrahydrofolate reductase [Fimbriimonas ginsengisoli]AIE85507.1 MetX [Fimbriimonas ginsengisoli Gsoil 348]
MRFTEALKRDFLIGDGANGTCLAERGFHRQPYDLANLQAPDLVREVHLEYFDAGADFVETNTFQANRIRLVDLTVDVRELNLAGARLAREAAGDRLVLGAIGPCGKPMEPIGHITEAEVGEAVREQAQALADGGVDGFILETYTDICELKVAVEAVQQVSSLPIIVSKAYIEDGEMLAEGLPVRCTKAMGELGVAAVGANCIVGPQRMLDLVRQIAESTELPIIAFPTPGLPQLVKGQIVYDTSPEYFAKAASRLVEEGAKIVGGCCGTTPAHIRALRRVLESGRIKPKPRTTVAAVTKERAPLATTEPSELAQKLGRKFVVAVEMDVPRGLNLNRLLAGARSLKISGADVINISDGARARLRMNPAAVSQIIQSQVGIEVTMHFSCRDRNLLAIQSDLLGWHALGLRNILAVTGDPANIGDYPSATSVFDIDSIGLCRILNRFNEGIDLAGYSVGVKCGFTIACAFNPRSLDPVLELDRLKRKVDAGASVVYTQPVFDDESADIAAKACDELGVPCLVGLLPLRSGRHTEFMHNEVPGIRIPEWLRQRMADAENDVDAVEIGLEEAQRLAVHIKSVAKGIYLMPPFGSHAIAERVMAAL